MQRDASSAGIEVWSETVAPRSSIRLYSSSVSDEPFVPIFCVRIDGGGARAGRGGAGLSKVTIFLLTSIGFLFGGSGV